jgi:hypothetical protein
MNFCLRIHIRPVEETLPRSVPAYLSVGPRACREGSGWGVGGARQRPEARDIAKMKREEKGWRELMEKANGFITC